jgi:hypothetical protein
MLKILRGSSIKYENSYGNISLILTPIAVSFILILSIFLACNAPSKNTTVSKLKKIEHSLVDCTEILQSAIDNEDEIHLDSGTYRVCKPLFFKKSKVKLVGNSSKLLFEGNPTQRMIYIENSDISFEEIQFDGGNKQVGGSLIYLADNTKNIIFKKCQFSNIAGTHQIWC